MIKQPIIEKIFDNSWITIYPDCTDKFSDDYYYAVELMDSDPKKSEMIFKKIISACGNGHVDAILHLGLLYNDTDKTIEGNALVIKAYKLAVDAFPSNFNPGVDQLPWSELENRPILRAFHCYGLELMKEKSYDKAIREYDFILKVNPNDHQGVRYLILDCLLYLKRPADILLLEKIYPDEHSVEFLYGKFLALYQLGKKNEAAKQLKVAKNAFPYVAEELIKAEHIFPANEFDKQYGTDGYGFPIGSRQEAFDYWETTQNFWDREKNIKDFILDTK